jgi:hypothetical protein
VEFHDYLRLLHAQRSVGLDTCGKQYMELCMSLHLCLMPSAADRRQFGELLAKKHSTNYSMTVMARARKFHGEARELRDKAMSEVQGCG